MQKLFVILSCAVILGMFAPQVQANAVEAACRQTDRSSATASMCRCVGQVASQKLTRSDQRRVAKWFSDPHQAQVTRQSDRRRDEQLWARYKAFGEAAARACG